MLNFAKYIFSTEIEYCLFMIMHLKKEKLDIFYRIVILYLAMDTGQVDFNCHGGTNFWVVHQ